MATNIEIIRQSISAITKILADKDIEVTQTGTGAYVKAKDGIPTLVNIPYIPDNASDELILAINGFLDHEVAHILFTDFSPDIAKSMPSKVAFSILNILEDCRIEACMQKRFAGSAMNLDGVREFLVEKHMIPEFEKALASENPKMIMSSLMVSAMRAWAGQDAFVKFMKDKWHHLDDLSERLKDEIPKIATLTSTRDAAKLATKIFELMSESEPADEPDKSESESEEEVEKPGKADESEGSGEEKSTKKKKPDLESKEEAESDPSSSVEDESEDSDEEDGDDSDSEDPDDVEEDPDESDTDSEIGGGEFDAEDGDDSDESGGSPSADSGGKFSDLDFDGDVSKAISKAISKETLKEARDSKYRIFSTDFDTVEPLVVLRHHEEEARKAALNMQSDVMHITGPLQKTLERMIKAKTKVRNIPGKRSGSVNPSSLFRLKTGDDRVFRQKDMGISNDVAVSILIDCSGSMSGNKIRLAMLSAFAICDVLSRTGITCEAIGFTTHSRRESEMGRKIDSALKADENGSHFYSRTEALNMPIFKSFKEGFVATQKMRLAYGSAYGVALKNNVDGECLRIAARRLVSNTSEKGKQLIVLSDGLPEACGNRAHIVRDLKDAVSDVEKMGVSVMGIGIDDYSVKDYYKKNAVISNIDELPSAIMKELKSILIG